MVRHQLYGYFTWISFTFLKTYPSPVMARLIISLKD